MIESTDSSPCPFYPYCKYEGKKWQYGDIVTHILIKHKVRRSNHYSDKYHVNGSNDTLEIAND